MRDEFFEEPVVLRRSAKRSGGASRRHAKGDDVAAFLYDLVIIVAGLAGAVILLRLLVEAFAA